MDAAGTAGLGRAATSGMAKAPDGLPPHEHGCLTTLCHLPPCTPPAVLVRPLLEFEAQKGCADVVQVTGAQRIRLPAKPNGVGLPDATGGYQFEFDR